MSDKPLTPGQLKILDAIPRRPVREWTPRYVSVDRYRAHCSQCGALMPAAQRCERCTHGVPVYREHT